METRYYITGDSAESIEDAKKVTVAQALNEQNKTINIYTQQINELDGIIKSPEIISILSEQVQLAITDLQTDINTNIAAIAAQEIIVNKLKGTVIFDNVLGTTTNFTPNIFKNNKYYAVEVATNIIEYIEEDITTYEYEGKQTIFFKFSTDAIFGNNAPFGVIHAQQVTNAGVKSIVSYTLLLKSNDYGFIYKIPDTATGYVRQSLPYYKITEYDKEF